MESCCRGVISFRDYQGAEVQENAFEIAPGRIAMDHRIPLSYTMNRGVS